MMRSRVAPPVGRLMRMLVLTGALGGAGLAPASAQWLGVLPEGPIPPGNIVRSLMARGFLEVGRPRFNGDAYIVEGINARGMRLRLVVDAYDGSLISRTRLDEPLVPPANVGRERFARIEPFGGGPAEDDEFAPPRWTGPPVDRDRLPPPPAARRAERIDPPLMEPHRVLSPSAGKPTIPGRAERSAPQQRQAKKIDPALRQPSAAVAPQAKGKEPAEPQAAPAAPPPLEVAKPEQAQEPAAVAALPTAPQAASPEPVTPPAPGPIIETAVPARVIEAPVAQAQPASRSVRVIHGVTPMDAQAQPRDPLDLPKPDVPPPVTLD
jgi:hypothetical protein